jgi:carbon monoxide dehydrogenase subunit G
MTEQLRITARIRIRATPERVWQTAMDWSRQHEWIPATTSKGGTGKGAEIAARTAIGPVGFTDTMIVTEWDPPRRCVTRHTGHVVRGDGIFEVVPAGDLSEFRWTELVDLPVPAAIRPAATMLAQWTVGPLVRIGLDYALRRLARLIESGAS